MLSENLDVLAGKPVVDFRQAGDITDFSAVAPRLRCEYDGPLSIRDYLAMLLDEPGVEQTTSLVIGLWMENGEAFQATPAPAIEMLVSLKEQLPNIDALFFGGDIILPVPSR